jgi:tetratricopeptide (TPR) repeat protein
VLPLAHAEHQLRIPLVEIQSADALAYQGRTSCLAGDYVAAVNAYQASIGHIGYLGYGPERQADVRLALAEALRGAGRLQPAIDAFHFAIGHEGFEAMPSVGRAAAHAGLGHALRQSRQYHRWSRERQAFRERAPEFAAECTPIPQAERRPSNEWESAVCLGAGRFLAVNR